MSIHTDFTAAQGLALTAALHGEAVWDDLRPEWFDDGEMRRAAMCLHALFTRGTVSREALISEAITRSWELHPEAWLMWHVPAAEAVGRFLTARGAVEIEKAMTRALQHVESGVDPWRAFDDMVDQAHTLTRPMEGGEGVPWWTWDEVMAMHQSQGDWVLPWLLSEGERLVLTGVEGYGKSTLIYQLAVGAAFGVNPINYTEQYEPQRVMVLDVENWHETQVRDQMRTMNLAFRRHSALGEEPPTIALLKPRVIDLVDSGQRRMILDAVDAFQPNILIMGSGYKLADANDDWRIMATSIQRTADIARASSGCAVIIETHAGHGFRGDRNGYRPDGSSYWLRWPEFGYGLKPIPVESGINPVEMVGWRGDRVRDRMWPKGWTPGGVLPWTAIQADEWDARPDLGGRKGDSQGERYR